jgi:hypothetical protein
MKPLERISITLILCLTLLAAVWLHGRLNRYEVIVRDTDFMGSVTRYDRITGRAWRIGGPNLRYVVELGGEGYAVGH